MVIQTDVAPPLALARADNLVSDRSRIIIYSHDTYGLGHLRRCTKIAKALKAAFTNSSILIITGSPHAGKYELPDGVDFVKLPAVVKTNANQYEPRSLGGSFEDILRLRQNLIMETVRTFNPHLLIVDHAPLGMKGEMKETLSWLKNHNPECGLILGLRDIIDEPDSVIASWLKDDVYDYLDHIYDRILVYGPSSVFDPVYSYRFSEKARDKTSFTDYIVDFDGGDEHLVLPEKEKTERKQVFLTVGGGEDGVHIVRSYMEMLSRYVDDLNVSSTIVCGPFFPSETKVAIKACAESLRVELHDFVSDITGHMRSADLVISMGGYNTVTEILANAPKALIIPREYPRKEQLMRAQRLSETGVISYVSAETLTTETLHERVADLLNDNDQPIKKARENGTLSLNGGSKIVEFCRPMLESRIEVAR